MRCRKGILCLLPALCGSVVSSATSASGAECWRVRGGEVSFWSPSGILQISRADQPRANEPRPGTTSVASGSALPVSVSNETTFTIDSSGIRFALGDLRFLPDVVVSAGFNSVELPGPRIEPVSQGVDGETSVALQEATPTPSLILRQANIQFHRANRQFIITSDVTSISRDLARLLGHESLASIPLGFTLVVLDAELDSATEPTPESVLAGSATAAVGDIGPDVIVSDLQGFSSYGTVLTCRDSGNICEDDADCNACSDTAGPCLLDSDCRICSVSGVACSTSEDCKTCSGSGLPCTTNAECGGTDTCDANQTCDVSGATCLVSGDVCETAIASFAVGTISCNIGDEPATWLSLTNQHPVIAQNLYRLKDDRFEQIGLSWVKHGFFAQTGTLCGECTPPPGPMGSQLGVGCSDPYSASLNGQQDYLGPRSEVNPHTGVFPYPFTAAEAAPVIGKRLQVHVEDLDLTLNDGALYFVEGQYITPDDAQAGNGNNNASYRRVEVSQNLDGRYVLHSSPLIATTQRQECGIRAWQDSDPTVVETDVQIPGEGLLIVSAKARDLGTGIWQYEYAVQNLNSHQGCRAIEIPFPQGAVITEIGFHDIEYHSGEPYDGDDWTASVSDSTIRWSTSTFDENPNANALRWGSLYNFRFRANVEPDAASVTLSLFRPGLFDEVSGMVIGPKGATIDCNDNGIADACDLDCTAAGCEWPCGGSTDCNANAVPDECELDCNQNEIADTCDIANGTSGDCNLNTVPDECEPDCDGDMVPDDCDTYDDTDGDGIPDCFDACPLTSPSEACQCPALGRCCFGEFFCLDGYPLANCEADGGTPDCQVSRLCRDGCLLNDWDDDGDIDLVDLSALQRCFTGSASDPGFLDTGTECTRVFDVTQDQAVDLLDYAIAHEQISGP